MTDFSDIKPYSDKQVTEVLANILKDEYALSIVSKYLCPRLTALTPRLTKYIISKYLLYKTKNINSTYAFQQLLLPYAQK